MTSLSTQIAIVAAGPTGLAAAITAAERGHQVILCEKDGELGGAIRYARYVSFKGQLELFRQYLIRQVEASSVEVRLNTPVTPELAEEIAPDVLICAIGAEPVTPDIPGAGGPNVVLAANAHEKLDELGQTVAIVGAGLTGTELGIELGLRGKKAIVIGRSREYAKDSNPQHRNAIHYHREQYVDFRLNTTCVGITEEGVEVVDALGSRHLILADSVVLAVGSRSLSEQVEALRDCAPDFQWIGDCYRPGKVTDAISRGYFAALDI